MSGKDRPNILLLLTDMQRADTIGALGNPVIRTPHLDRLCREGVGFTSAYTPCPVCVPARACLHYGQYTQRTGLHDNGRMPDDDGTSYVARLGEAGYRTHAIGKCHFTPDSHALRGFQSRESQEEIVRDPQADDYHRFLFENGFDHLTDTHGVRGEMYYIPQVAQMPARLHPTQWIGDRAEAFINEQAESDQPWYLTASFIHPHPPLAPPAPWHKLYRGPDMPLPRVPADHETYWTHINRVQNRYKYRDRGIDLQLVRMIKAYYYACVSFIDFQVGRLLAALERSGELDNTLIVFTSDHGEYLGDYHCFGKRGMHDASSRVPMIARWPEGFGRGEVCAEPVSLVDLASTFCEAGGAAPGDYDGLPLMRLADGSAEREHVFSQFQSGPTAQYMIVSRDHKYFYSAADDDEFFFDRRVDPHEMQRLPPGLPFTSNTQPFYRLRETLLNYLEATGQEEAYERTAEGKLTWRRHDPPAPVPRHPDAGLLIQDHPWADQSIPGYSAGA